MRPMRPVLPILSMLMMLLLGGWESSCFGDPGTGVETPPPQSIANGSYVGPVSGVIEATGDTLSGTLSMRFTVRGGQGTFTLNGAWTGSGSTAPVSLSGIAGYYLADDGGIGLGLDTATCTGGGEKEWPVWIDGQYDVATHHLLIAGGYINMFSVACSPIRKFELLPSDIIPQ